MKLSCAEFGDGPPLLILHGLFGSGRNWTSIARKLAETRRVLAVDLRNHGASPWDPAMDYPTMAADVLELIEEKALDRPVVLGHSMGGKTAMAAALAAPRAVGALIVADIAPVAYRHGNAAYVAAMRAIDLSRVERRGDADEALRDAVPEAGVRGFLLQNLVFGEDRPRWQLNLDAIAASMDRLIDFPYAAGEARYGGPALFIAGGASGYVRPEHREAIRAFFPAANIETIAGAGHWPHAEKPREFLEIATRFLAAIE
jgi:pimeloyl-ACP methyl ester carboxylesterase